MDCEDQEYVKCEGSSISPEDATSTDMPRREDSLVTFMNVEKATKLVAELGLLSLQLGDYIVIVKPDFDLLLGGEPYVALMLLFNPRNGTFITRDPNQLKHF